MDVARCDSKALVIAIPPHTLIALPIDAQLVEP
jgi:hypothetical protein